MDHPLPWLRYLDASDMDDATVDFDAQQAAVLAPERRIQVPPPPGTVHPALALRSRKAVTSAEPQELDLRQGLSAYSHGAALVPQQVLVQPGVTVGHRGD